MATVSTTTAGTPGLAIGAPGERRRGSPSGRSYPARVLYARSIPTHDSELLLYAIGGIVLLIVGGFLVRFANRRKETDER